MKEDVKIGQLKVWHIPQVPMKAFEVFVENVDEAVKVCDILADYDLFQYENNIKSDYCNANGLVIWDGKEWTDWYDDIDFDEYVDRKIRVK